MRKLENVVEIMTIIILSVLIVFTVNTARNDDVSLKDMRGEPLANESGFRDEIAKDNMPPSDGKNHLWKRVENTGNLG